MKFKKLEIAILIFSVIVFVTLLFQAVIKTGFAWAINFNLSANVGTTLAGILSFISILLILLTLKNQSYTFSISKLESRFFELLKFHRDNVQEMEYRSPESTSKDNPIIRKGHKVFVEIYNEIETAICDVNSILVDYLGNSCGINEIFRDKSVFEKRKSIADKNYNRFSVKELEIANIAYLVVFVGVSRQGVRILRPILENQYKKEFVDVILCYFIEIPVKYSKYRSDFEKSQSLPQKAKYVKYFGGHQHRLGHYFRHLYQTVNYIDTSTELFFPEKYNYIKTLRAQLSTYEQAVVFFNSISTFGLVWELQNDDENKKLITKYNFIKNIPAEFSTVFILNNFYPLVEYEGSARQERKKYLERKVYK